MSVFKLGLRVLCLWLALGACMLVNVGLAQAETGAFWLVNGINFGAGLSPALEAETDVEGALLTTLGGKAIHIKCPTVKLKEAHLTEPGAEVSGFAVYSGCKFLELVTVGGVTKEVGACKPSAEKTAGLIVTNKFLGSIVLHEGKGALELKPATGSLFVTILLGEECAFGEKLEVGGVLFLEDSSFSTDAVKHLVQGLSALTKLVVNKGSTAATIDGSAWTSLGGTHKGMTFSGQPD